MSAEPSLRSMQGGRLLVSVMTASAVLTGCVSFSPDGGFAAVSSVARERVAKDVVWIRSDNERSAVEQRVAELLAKPLSVDDAVQIALLNNRGLQASYAELQLSEAALVQVARLPNPTFSMLRASNSDTGIREFKIEQALTFNVFSLITMPQATEIERRRFEQTQRTVTLEMLRLANAARKAYYTAIAAAEIVRYQQQVRDAAEAAAELARRLAAVGNWNKLDQLREQSFYAEAALGLAGAEQANISAREQLIRLLGLWGSHARFSLPERLPDLPTAPVKQDNIEQLAMTQRLDLQAVRLHTEALAKNLSLTKTTRFINVLEFGPARVLEGARDSGYKTGYEVSFELPLFDWGGAKVATAEALYMQAINLAAETAINARSEVREAYSVYRSQYDIAKHFRDEIVPISKRISEENQLRYNGMLIGVFELLADARSQIASVNGYIDSLRDFWIAQADLDMALIGKPDLNLPEMPRASATAAAEH